MSGRRRSATSLPDDSRRRSCAAHDPEIGVLERRRVAADFMGRAGRDQTAGDHDSDAVREPLDIRQVVAGQ